MTEQQAVVNSLSNVVVIIDESGNSTLANESMLEDQLIALGEKWAHVCRFVEERGAVLELVARNWKMLEDEEVKFNNWITKLDKRLSEMEESAAETEPSSQFVAELIKRLQRIEKEMEGQHVYCSKIADEGQKLLQTLDSSSVAASVIEAKLKKLTDTWDQTVQRMENLGVALTKASAMASKANEKVAHKEETSENVASPEVRRYNYCVNTHVILSVNEPSSSSSSKTSSKSLKPPRLRTATCNRNRSQPRSKVNCTQRSCYFR